MCKEYLENSQHTEMFKHMNKRGTSKIKTLNIAAKVKFGEQLCGYVSIFMYDMIHLQYVSSTEWKTRKVRSLYVCFTLKTASSKPVF